MTEISNKESSDRIKNHVENYKDIKPDNTLSVKDSAKSWDNMFSKIFDENDFSDSREALSSQTKELNNEQRQELKEKLGWSDKKIDEKCTISENGVIKLKTDCQDLEGKKAECGVTYVRNTIDYNGIKIEGVFAKFDSKFDTVLPSENLQSSSTKQFDICNKRLSEAITNDSELAKNFTKEQLTDIKNGITPRGFTWHHHEEPGRMQLVKTEDHDKTIGGASHTGGNSIWGNKSIEKTPINSVKGESF